MGNIIIPGGGGGKWTETAGERSLRQKGHKTTEHGIFETGITTGASELRKDNAPALIAKIARCLQSLAIKMAEVRWDDTEVCLCIGIQVRNKWEQSPDGEWVEVGTIDWIGEAAKKALKK